MVGEGHLRLGFGCCQGVAVIAARPRQRRAAAVPATSLHDPHRCEVDDTDRILSLTTLVLGCFILKMNDLKLCECGCGLPAPIATKTSTSQGYTKGVAMRFVAGHSSKGRPAKEYRRTRLTDGTLYRSHRLRAEKALGKPLPPKAVVHHADGSIDVNAPLVICEDQSYHMLLHYRTRIVRAGGNPNTDKICYRCRRVLPLESFSLHINKAGGRHGTCKECRRATEQGSAAA